MNTNISNNTNIFCVHKRLDIRKIRLIRDIRVHKKNPVFTRKISCPPVLSRASVEHSCCSSYSCSKEESRVLQSFPAQAWNIRVIRVIRVQKKNLVSSSPFSRKRRKFELFELFVFTRKIPCSQEIYPCSHPHAKIIKIQ